MRRNFTTLLFFGLTSIASAQSMKEGLSHIVSECYQAWKAETEGGEKDENGKPIEEYGKIEYDLPNGYVETSGGWPTCGCGCEAKAAAFKQSNGKYLYVSYEEWNCQDYGKSSFYAFGEGDFHDVDDFIFLMPENFGIESFAGYKVEKPQNYSFQVLFDIPKVGTEMNVRLRVLPIGSLPNEENGLTYQSKQGFIDDQIVTSGAWSVASKFSNDILLQIANGNYDKLSAADKKEINNIVSSSSSNGRKATASEVALCLSDLKTMYDIYMSLECVSIKLKWNKQTSRFEIKSKGEKPKQCSFKEFLTKVVELAGERC